MTKTPIDWSEKARNLDENDQLSHMREHFNIPLARNTCDNSKITDDRKCIYLNGNSLGCMVNIVKFSLIKQKFHLVRSSNLEHYSLPLIARFQIISKWNNFLNQTMKGFRIDLSILLESRSKESRSNLDSLGDAYFYVRQRFLGLTLKLI